jgi:hypothetical protein
MSKRTRKKQNQMIGILDVLLGEWPEQIARAEGRLEQAQQNRRDYLEELVDRGVITCQFDPERIGRVRVSFNFEALRGDSARDELASRLLGLPNV